MEDTAELHRNCVEVVFTLCCCLYNAAANVFLLYFLVLSDEEKVGPWPRGPIFPFRKKALQRPRIFKVKHLQDSACRPSVHPNPDTPV